uniref:HMG box domain-containing protein n=1 Tax=Corethron hystrix TaxID=216773 RepID=A0A7S1B7U8_9STRA
MSDIIFPGEENALSPDDCEVTSTEIYRERVLESSSVIASTSTAIMTKETETGTEKETAIETNKDEVTAMATGMASAQDSGPALSSNSSCERRSVIEDGVGASEAIASKHDNFPVNAAAAEPASLPTDDAVIAGKTVANTSDPSKKRPISPTFEAQSNLGQGGDYSKPKKARTAYFIFMAEKREEFKKMNRGGGVAEMSKVIGAMWSALSPDEKLKYQALSAEEKRQVAKYVAAFPSSTNGDCKNGGAEVHGEDDPLKLLLPVSRTRAIIKMDPEVRGASKECTTLLTKATELFIALAATEVSKISRQSNRRTILIDDIVLMCERGKFVWLKDDIKDLAKIREHIREAEKEARLELKKNSIGDGTGEGEKIVKNTLLNYFGSN